MSEIIKATAERLDKVPPPGTELVPVDDDPFAELDGHEPSGTGDEPRFKAQVVRGRYQLPHPVTGKPGKFTRVSNIAKAISDTYHLDRWRDRTIVVGMALRPDLAELAASLDVTEDRDELQEIAEKAKEAAGANKGANMGTALHAYAQRLDGGEDLTKVRLTGKTRADVDAYRSALSRWGITMYPEYMERVVFNSAANAVGRIDRIGLDAETWDLPRIVDLKTQKTMDFGGMEIAIQVAIYAHADFMYDEHTGRWVPMPEVDTQTGIVVHLPVGKARAEKYPVPLDTGWGLAKLALAVRKARTASRGLLVPEPDDRAYRVRANRAQTREEFSQIFSDAYDAGLWSDDLKAYTVAKWEAVKARALPGT